MTFDQIVTKIQQSILLDEAQKAFLVENFPSMSAELQQRTLEFISELETSETDFLKRFLVQNPEFLVQAKYKVQSLRQEELSDKEKVATAKDQKILAEIDQELADIFSQVES